MSVKFHARAVFFDAVGTLFRVRGGVGRVYWEIARPYGVTATPEAIDQVFHEVFRAAPPLAFSRIQSRQLRRSEKDWWHAVVKEVFRRVGMVRKFDAYFEEVYRAFSGIRGWELYPETRRVLRDLKKRNFIVGIISNFDSRILTVCTDLRIFEFIDTLQISSRAGFAKPHPRIFQMALEEHDLAPREAVHVGDHLEEDVNGSRAAGLIPVYLDRTRSGPPPGMITISDLTELLSLIDPLSE